MDENQNEPFVPRIRNKFYLVEHRKRTTYHYELNPVCVIKEYEYKLKYNEVDGYWDVTVTITTKEGG